MIFISFNRNRVRPASQKVVPTIENIKTLWAFHKIRQHKPEPIQEKFNKIASTVRITKIITKCNKRLAKLEKKQNPTKLKSVCLTKAANQMLYWHTLKDFAEANNASKPFIDFIEANIEKYGSILQTINDQS